MKVKKELEELNLDTSLIVVMGSHHGIIYKLENDELTKVDDHRVDTPVHSDNEGISQRGGRGEGQVIGGILEPQKEKAQEDFSKEFVKKLQNVNDAESIKSIYLFAPAEVNNYIDSDWSSDLKDLIEERFDGNYTTKQPSEIIDMLFEEISSKNSKKPTGEAKEILEKTEHLK